MSPRTDAASAPSALRYALPAGAGTVWLGLGPAALTGLAATLLISVALMLTGAPLLPVLLIAAAGTGVAVWPVGRRTALQWLPLLTGQLMKRLLRRDREHAPLHTLSTLTASPHDELRDPHSARQPRRLLRVRPEAGAVEILSAPGDVALLDDPIRGTTTIVLATSPTGRFGLLDPSAQDTELHRWGTSLASLLSLPDLRHVQWLIHTGPDTTVAPDPAGAGSRARDHTLLVATAHAQARTQHHLLTITLATPHRGRARRTLDSISAERVLGAARDASAALLGADILSYPLTATELPALLRTLLDPTTPTDATGTAACADDGPLTVSGRSCWTHCRTDDTLHRSYAISGWPRLELPADWLAPLLHHAPPDGTARTLVVQARPVTPEHAARRARASAAKARLDTADRQRLGFTPAASSALDELDAQHTEAELLAGYRMAELTSLLTLHAPDQQLLEDAARSLRTVAVSQRLDLRPLHGQHSRALAVTLPLGLPTGRRP